MTGWLADFFRFAWGLLYWNARKSWFRFRGGRSPCPCQCPSDSGRALETQCEAMMQWNSPARFRRVCPLLVETPQGWRCSVSTADVRPFWRRALGYYGGTLAALYFTCVFSVFIFLRLVGYPVSILHVSWPPSWHRVGQARGWYFTEQARKAFAANHPGEALLYLSNAYEFDSSNYVAGLTLAKMLQSGQPVPSNRLYERLYHEHLAQREETATEWFRALLARGDFQVIRELSFDRLVHQTSHASGWMRALVFASRQSRRDDTLRALRASPDPAVAAWRPLIDAELLFMAGRNAAGRAALDAPGWSAVPAYGAYYQVSRLLELGDGFAALDRLGAADARLDSETRCALTLAIFARQGARRPLEQQVDLLFAERLTPPALKVLCAQLIRQPDPVVLDELFAKFQREPLPFNSDTAGVYFSLLCAAGVQGDWAKFSAVGNTLSAGSGISASLLVTIENFFRGRTTSDRATSILPMLPLPVEVTYAMIERYPGKPPAPRKAQP